MLKIWSSFQAFSPLLRFYPWAIPVVILLGTLASLAEGVGISLFIPLLQGFGQTERVAPSGNQIVDYFNGLFSSLDTSQRLLFISLCILGCILVKAMISCANVAVSFWFSYRIGHRLRSGIFQQLLSVSYAFLETNDSGRFTNSMIAEIWQTLQALSVLIKIIVSLCTIFVFVVLLLLISWKLTLLAGLGTILITVILQLMSRQAAPFGAKAVQINKALVERTNEGLSGMKVIRAFGREDYEQARFDAISNDWSTIFFKINLLFGVIAPLFELLSVCLLLVILLLCLTQGFADLPSLLTFVFILYRLQPQISQFNSMRVQLVSLTSSVQDVVSLLDPSDKSYIESGYVPFTGLKQRIALKSVNFRYNAQEQLALKDITIEIPSGKTTALVGPSGAGKSTIIGLICRFYDPSEGELWVDNQRLQDLNLVDWRNHIAIVSQDIYVFNTTIRDNIAYGHLEATDEQIIEAAKLANAHQFICQLPYGYDTKVGDRGVRLSGGQRQRIALARAIVRNPDILILDEATNALDSIAENLIQEAINTLSQDRTVIIIAHRLSTIEQADQIIVLENGQVAEQGNLESLLEHDGLFAKLYSLQHGAAQTTRR